MHAGECGCRCGESIWTSQFGPNAGQIFGAKSPFQHRVGDETDRNGCCTGLTISGVVTMSGWGGRGFQANRNKVFGLSKGR